MDLPTSIRILVGCKPYSNFKEAARRAGIYLNAFGGRIHLLTCVRSQPDAANANATLSRFKEGLEYATKIPVDIHVEVGALSPGECIANFTKQNDIQLVIIGIEKRSDTGELVLGSNARCVILKAHCPVLAVKEEPGTQAP